MVSPLARIRLFASCIALAGLVCAHSVEAAAYNLGDTLESDLVATERMTVIDPDATRALQEREEQNVHVLCRFYPNTADDAEAALHKGFSTARLAFRAGREKNFNRRTLDDTTINSENFRKFVSGFQNRNASFPMTAELAASWARGQSDGGIEEDLAARLREAMQRPIRPYGLPDGLKLTYTVRLVSLPDRDTPATLELADSEGRNVARTNLITLPWAKTRFQETFHANEQAWGRFAAGFIRENCFPDAQLTRQARTARTEQLKVADTYEAGQVIARKGDTVDSKILAAIRQQLELAAANEQKQQLAAVQMQVAVTQERGRLWLYTICGFALGSVLVVIFLQRRRHASMLPVRGSLVDAQVSHPNDWRAWMGPHLAQLLSGNVFQRLMSQRQQMIATQERAAAEMDELESQLERVRAPLEDRLRAYEKRIAELERELSVRGEENEALLRAKIGMVKKQLEAVRQKNRVELN